MSKAVIYGHVSPNVIDGSSIWLVSIAEALSRIFDEVYVQLKEKVRDQRLVSSVTKLQNVYLIEPDEDLTVEAASKAVADFLSTEDVDVVLVRGFDAANAFCMNLDIAPKLWSYVTELPFPPQKLSRNNMNRLERIASRSRRVFAQTEAARSYLEAIVPSAAGKTVLLPPMIPDQGFRARGEQSDGGELKIVYAGKLAKDWRTFEMLDLPRALAEVGVAAKLTVVGSKFNHARDESYWVDKMRSALQRYDADPESGVHWAGAKTREETLTIIANSDLGIGWRSSALDSSLEISTKALEYAAAGTPPIVNRTEDHEDLLGPDYPFFVDGHDDVVAVAAKIKNGLMHFGEARSASVDAAEYYSMAAAVDRLRRIFANAGVQATGNAHVPRSKARQRVVIASHDMKFMGELMDYLSRSAEFEVRQDRWDSLHDHDEEASAELANWADIVFCEWAGPALAWYSRKKPKGTRLYSRLHRFELDGPWLADVDWTAVDGMVFVSELYRRMAIEQLHIDPSVTHVIPNAVDLDDFDRPKLPTARFTLGFIGMVPIHKRPDRAIVLLQELLQHDDRYVLRFKGRLPWEYPYEWKNAVQKQLYLEFFHEVVSDKEVLNHVVFDNFSADVASWQRRIGFMLSPSEVESFHMAPAEGMAARSIPIFWQREGVSEIFGSEFASRTLDENVRYILEARDEAIFNERGNYVREVAAKWAPNVLMAKWRMLFLGRDSRDTRVALSGL